MVKTSIAEKDPKRYWDKDNFLRNASSLLTLETDKNNSIARKEFSTSKKLENLQLKVSWCFLSSALEFSGNFRELQANAKDSVNSPQYRLGHLDSRSRSSSHALLMCKN